MRTFSLISYATILAGVGVLLIGCACANDPPIYLSDLNPSTSFQEWGKLGIDRSVGGNPLTIATTIYSKGLGTHANSRITYKLRGSYRVFTAEVGGDFETASADKKLQFRVLGDRRVLYESRVLTSRSDAVRIRVNIGGVDELCLVVLDGGDGISSDHADWADARLER